MARHSTIVFALLLSAIGCTAEEPPAGPETPEPPFQGPLNGNFEAGTNATAASWSSQTPAAAGCPDYGSGNPTALARTTATSFMPSNGVWFMAFSINNQSPQLFQDNVDISQSTTMRFDYSLAVTSPSGSTGVLIEMIFTSAGSTVLWSRTVPAGSSAPLVNVLDHAVPLPAASAPGRLMLRVTSSCAPGGTLPSGHFHIDNIRVQ